MTGAIERSWCDLSAELLNGIAERLLYAEQIRFRSVCKRWRSNTNPTKHAADKLPWVMFSKQNSFYLHDPNQKKSYIRHNEILRGTIIHASKHGWLLLSKGTYPPWIPDSSFFFYTPFTHETIKLPPIKLQLLDMTDTGDYTATFSTPPTSPDCVVFVLTLPSEYSKSIWTSTCSPRDTTWRNTLVDGGNYEYIRSLAFARGAFYCLFSDNVMGSFKVAKQEWKIHPLDFSEETTDTDMLILYNLVECQDGNLLVICKRVDKSAEIFRYDQSKMKWFKVESLDNAMLFYGRTPTSMLLPAVGEASELANSVHLITPTGLVMHPGDCHHGISSCYIHQLPQGQTLRTYDWIDQNLWGQINPNLWAQIWIQPLKEN